MQYFRSFGCYLVKMTVIQGFLYTGCIKKTEQLGKRSQIRKAAEVMKFLVQIDYFGTYDVE